MIWFLILFVITVVGLLIILKKKKRNDRKDSVVCFVSWILILLAMTFVGSSLNFTTYISYETTTEQVSVQQIVALQDNIQENGYFFLGTGDYEGKMYYCYYTETEYGLKFNKLSAECDRVYIKYTNDNDVPRVEETVVVDLKIVEEIPNIWLDFFSWMQFKDYSVGEVFAKEVRSFTSSTYTIYVPEGSITTNYDIDLQ